MAKGLIVGRGYVPYWRKDSEREGYTEERREDL